VQQDRQQLSPCSVPTKNFQEGFSTVAGAFALENSAKPPKTRCTNVGGSPEYMKVVIFSGSLNLCNFGCYLGILESHSIQFRFVSGLILSYVWAFRTVYAGRKNFKIITGRNEYNFYPVESLVEIFWIFSELFLGEV
jgi:hypothetical protein